MPPNRIKRHHSPPVPRAISPARRERRVGLKLSLQGRASVKKTGLLDLPNELLNLIYALSMPIFDETHISSTTMYEFQSSRLFWTPHSHAVIPALCQVNSKIRQDTMPMFLATNKFTFYNYRMENFLLRLEVLTDWLLQLTDVHTARMRSFKIGRSMFRAVTISFDTSKKSWSLDWPYSDDESSLSEAMLAFERRHRTERLPWIVSAMKEIRIGEMGEWDTGMRVKNLVRLFYAVFRRDYELRIMSRARHEKLRVFLPDDSWLGTGKDVWMSMPTK